MTYKKQLVWLIAVSTLVRIFISSTQELGNSEAYYWVLSTKLQWNYFDHPPMVAWLIRLTTANLLLHNELFVRSGAILSSAVCTWLMFKLGTQLSSERAGWFAALLYSTSMYAGIGIASFILPDSPQMVFWLSSIYILLKIVTIPADRQVPTLYWVLFGILSGLCIMSKVHGVVIWIGAVAYFLIYDRRRLYDKSPYLSLGITALIISPIIIWNLQHNFVTYRFNSSRVTVIGESLQLQRFVKQLFEIIFSTGPIQIFLLCTGTYQAIKGKMAVDIKSIRLILLCSLPLILILLFVSLFREVYPHWPGPALSTLLILPAVSISLGQKSISNKLPSILKFATVYALFAGILLVLITNYFPGTMSEQKEGIKTGANDVTLDLYGWQSAATAFNSLYRSDISKNKMPINAPIVITDWALAAHIDYYMAHLTAQETFGLGRVMDLHQYFWMNSSKVQLLKGDSSYYIVPSNLFDNKVFDRVLNSFDTYDFALTIVEKRSGLVCKEFYIVRLYGYKGLY